MISFVKDNHFYSGEGIDWLGVTSLVKTFSVPFDEQKRSLSSSRNSKSKWYGLTPEEIRAIWRKERNRSTELGDWYHSMVERDTLSSTHSIVRDIPHLVIKPRYEEGVKSTSTDDQILDDFCVYPEHMVFLKSAGLIGQSDMVRTFDKEVHILDHKTNKKIDKTSFVNWEGISQMMLDPLSHLPDSNFWHYALQLSLYMYMILKHNPKFRPGSITIDHIIFDQEGEDRYGYPIYTKDGDNYIIKDIVHYDVPYLKSEVMSVLAYLKDNRETIKSKIYEKVI